jgi:hypothetical protein
MLLSIPGMLFVNDVKIVCVKKSPDDFTLMQHNLDWTQGWCAAKIMKPNTDKKKESSLLLGKQILSNCDFSRIQTDTVKTWEPE